MMLGLTIYFLISESLWVSVLSMVYADVVALIEVTYIYGEGLLLVLIGVSMFKAFRTTEYYLPAADSLLVLFPDIV